MMRKGAWVRLWRDLTAAPEFYRERRDQPLELAQAVAEPALSVLLVVTLVAGVATFVTALLPVWDLAGLPPLAAATTTVAYFYGRRLQWSGVLWREWLVLLAPFVALWRLISLLTGSAAPASTAAGWLAHPSDLFDGAFVVGSGLLLIAWTQGLGYGRDLSALHPRPVAPARRPEPGSRAYWEEDERRHGLYLPPPRAVAARWLGGGIVLAVLSALAAAGVRQTLTGSSLLRLVTLAAPDESAALPNVLAYMLGGLVLVGLAESSRLRANWAADGVAVMPGLARRALVALSILVALALGLALLLPTRYSMGLGDLLNSAFTLVSYAVGLVGSLLLGLIGVIAGALFALLGMHGGQAHPPAAVHPLPALGPSHGNVGDVLRSLLFWGAALAALCYCSAMLLRQAEGRVPALGRLRRVALSLLAWLAGLVRLLAGRVQQGAAGVARLARRLGGEARAHGVTRPPRPSWRRLGPRALVAYLYLSMEERARRLGLPRRSGQTALEYSRQLRQDLPDLEPDLSALTEMFLEARYSPHAFGEEQAGSARQVWRRVRARLQARRRG